MFNRASEETMQEKESGAEFCSCQVLHTDKVHAAQSEMLPETKVYNVAEFFKIFGDATRIRILRALSVTEMCVCDLSAVLGMSQSAVSHQLKTLKQARLVKNRKESKVVFYSLDDDHVEQILAQGLAHIEETWGAG